MNKEILKDVEKMEEKCIFCGNEGKFQTYQYYSMEDGKHKIATWCSNKCFELALDKMVDLFSEKFHCEKCLGKFEKKDFPIKKLKVKVV